MPRPLTTDRERLDVLVDRACRGLTPDEGAALRTAVGQLQQRATGAERQYELAMEGWNREADAQDQRVHRYRAAWQSARRRAAHANAALDHLLGLPVVAEYLSTLTVDETVACDHRDPNRLGARYDLATVCACGHKVSPPIFGRTISPMQQPPDEDIFANVQALMEQYVADQCRQQAAAQEAAIEAYLAAGGFTVLRTNPVEQVAADRDTLNHLGAALARISARDTLSLGQIGQLTGYPMVADDSLPPGEVHLRPRQRPDNPTVKRGPAIPVADEDLANRWPNQP